MKERNYKNLKFLPDLLLKDTDPRRCIALVAQGEWTINEELYALLQELEEKYPDNVFYKLDNSEGVLHHTIMQVVDFASYHEKSEEYLDQLETRVKQITSITSQISPYQVIFDDICQVSSGVAMIGETDIPLNYYRDLLRESGAVIKEPYKIDIAHSTLLRWTQDMGNTPIRAEKTWYATLNVTHWNLCIASWRMQKEEVTLLHSFNLSE